MNKLGYDFVCQSTKKRSIQLAKCVPYCTFYVAFDAKPKLNCAKVMLCVGTARIHWAGLAKAVGDSGRTVTLTQCFGLVFGSQECVCVGCYMHRLLGPFSLLSLMNIAFALSVRVNPNDGCNVLSPWSAARGCNIADM
jgi:hypothetical protein